jgi:iron complex transport system ATP-binding protein
MNSPTSEMHSPILTLDRVSLVRDGRRILHDVSFTVRPGEHWAVIGKNGAGKSFLLRMICGEHFPTTGTIEVLGKRFGEYDLWKLKVHIGVVSDQLQARYHPDERGEDIVLSGFFASIGLYDRVTQSMREKAAGLLEHLAIRHLRHRRFDQMSHGEQRRLLIARALVLDPALLILDEPCTGLDIASREEFLKALSAVTRSGVSLLLVTHHLEEIIPEINHVLFLKDGRVAGRGLKDDLLTVSLLRELFDHPVSVTRSHGRFFLRTDA